MSYYDSYEQERERRRTAWEQAPKECPHCKIPINQHVSAYGNDKPKQHCGATACRSATYRQRKADRLDAARKDADTRINTFAAQLPVEHAAAVRAMRDVLMSYIQPDYQHGHEQALAIIRVLEFLRCKHDRIDVLLDNASIAKRRADEAKEHNRNLEAIYTQRIAELESELSVFQLLENAVHNIATDQLRKQVDPPQRQPEPQEPEEDEDRAQVLLTLSQAGIKPYGGDEEETDEDDPEDEE